MNWASARCRCASWPRSTVKRAPESLAPASASSQPWRAPRSTWSLHREVEAARRAPAQDFAGCRFRPCPAARTRRGMFGMPSAISASLACTSASACSLALSLSPMPATSAISGGDVFALGLGLADRLGAGIAQVLQLLRLGRQRLRSPSSDSIADDVQHVAAGVLEARGGFGKARAQQSRIEHGGESGVKAERGLSLPRCGSRNADRAQAGPPTRFSRQLALAADRATRRSRHRRAASRPVARSGRPP